MLDNSPNVDEFMCFAATDSESDDECSRNVRSGPYEGRKGPRASKEPNSASKKILNNGNVYTWFHLKII